MTVIPYIRDTARWGDMVMYADEKLRASVEARMMPLCRSSIPRKALAEWQFRGCIHDGLNQAGDCELCGKAAEHLFEVKRPDENDVASILIDKDCLARLVSICVFNGCGQQLHRQKEREHELHRAISHHIAFKPVRNLADMLDNVDDRETWCLVVQVVHETWKYGVAPPTELAAIMSMMESRDIEYAPKDFSEFLAVNNDWDELKVMDESLLELILPVMSERDRKRLLHERGDIIPF